VTAPRSPEMPFSATATYCEVADALKIHGKLRQLDTWVFSEVVLSLWLGSWRASFRLGSPTWPAGDLGRLV
jgi:hypothetical protein